MPGLGYTGHRPMHIKESTLAWPPQVGCRAFLDNKFKKRHDLYVPLNAAERKSTEYQSATSGLLPEHYVVPPQRSGIYVLPIDRPLFTKSTYTDEFPDYLEVVNKLRNIDSAKIEDVFNDLDVRKEGVCLAPELPRILRAAMGDEDPPPLVLATIHNIVDKANLKYLTFDQLIDAILTTADYIEIQAKPNVPDPKPTNLDMSNTFSGSFALTSPNQGTKTSSRFVDKGRVNKLSDLPDSEKVPDPAKAPTFGPQSRVSIAASMNRPTTSETQRTEGSGVTRHTDDRFPTDSTIRVFTAVQRDSEIDSDLAFKGLHLGAMRKAQLAAENSLVGPSSTSPTNSKEEDFDLLGRSKPLWKPKVKNAAREQIKNEEEIFDIMQPDAMTTSQRDFGRYGSNPRTHPISLDVQDGHYTTTTELQQGTSRQSKHVPGYLGHIPSTHHGKVADHGLGATKRDTFHAKTNLSDTYVRRVPGYTGHLPAAATTASDAVDKPKGIAADSDYDKAAGNVESYWLASTMRR